MSLYSKKMEALIEAALEDGLLTEKEKQILFKKAEAEGIDLDEFEMVLDARLLKLKKAQKEKTDHPAPKSKKHGELRKCPSCGAILPALAVSCPECGYEFSGVSASSSYQILSDKISEIKKNASDKKNALIKSRRYSTKTQLGENYSSQEKALSSIDKDTRDQISSLVASFPVPNTKSDLFDLIMFLRSQGFQFKYEECMERASILFPDDPLYAKLKEIETDDKKKSAEYDRKVNRQANYAEISFLGTPILIIGLCIAEWSLLSIKWGWKLAIALLICPIIAIFIMKLFKKFYVK